jgi:hypothetical protein
VVPSGTRELARIDGFDGGRYWRRPARFGLVGASQMAQLGGEDADGGGESLEMLVGAWGDV